MAQITRINKIQENELSEKFEKYDIANFLYFTLDSFSKYNCPTCEMEKIWTFIFFSRAPSS